MFKLGRKSSKSSKQPPKKPSNDDNDDEDSPSKMELRDHRLATSSGSPTTNSGSHWDMESIEDQKQNQDDDRVEPRQAKHEPDTFSSPPPPAQASSRSKPSLDTTRGTTSQSQQQQSSSKSPNKASRISSTVKAQQIATSDGTARLNRILHDHADEEDEEELKGEGGNAMTTLTSASRRVSGTNRNVPAIPPVAQPDNESLVGKYVADYVVPPLVVDGKSIGGHVAADSTSVTTHMTQECLLSMRCKSFELTKNSEPVALGALKNPNLYAKHKRKLGLWGTATTKLKMGRHHKLRYVCLVRSTNRTLLKSSQKGSSRDDDDENDDMLYQDEELAEDIETMYNHASHDESEPKMLGEEADLSMALSDEQPQVESFEISSFPVLVCMALHQDGTNPDVRKLISLEKLTTIQNSVNNMVQLIFQGGDSVWLDFSDEEVVSNDDSATPQDTSALSGMRQEQFLWSLLQIHAMLCQSVVERNLKQTGRQRQTSRQSMTMQPPLQVRNLDRAELQYVAQVHGFLRDSPTLIALLERQRDIYQRDDEESKEAEDKDLAYDILMGNYTTRVALFTSVEEKADAEEVLNAITLEMPQDDQDENVLKLGSLLQQRMRDLEAETCRRLIAWEDEKHYSLMGQSALDNWDTTVDALSLSALFNTLDLLDKELFEMEEWLDERAAVIKPLTDDCRDIEEENRQLEQQWKSYDVLGVELRRLLQGVDLDRSSEKVLKNPASALVYSSAGELDVEKSERGVDKIYEAGQSLKDAVDSAQKAGGVHLLAVGERVEGLNGTADQFCTALSQIVVTVMEKMKSEVVAASDHGKVSKHDTHSMIAKKIRDTQRRFQSALLGYMKLIEILGVLKPSLIPAIRDAYSEMVAEGIMMKKRMKGYFQALPGKNSAYLNLSSKELQHYSSQGDLDGEKTVHAPDVANALSEMLPIVAREAYFTAALFGLSNNSMDARDKKRNFEAAKKAVDHSTQYFRYYVHRTCGILDSESELAGRSLRGDPMLSLVSSIYLNEAINQYVDQEKKGGDQSLSLAYVRATVLALRKKVDKQWVAWVEEQIDWIKSHPGVPVTGKRAGIFMCFSRFPTYLDHILMCCREGKPDFYTPEFSKIQVVNYYLQKMANAMLESLRVCAERETTDQQYAANVMRMENTYYFTQKLKERGPEMQALFQKQLTRAGASCKQSTDAYLGWMIKREFKPLHALFSQISRVRRDVGDKDVPIHVPRTTFVKTLQKESNREVMKEKIDIIYGRMEKHLCEEGGLLPVAWKALVKVLYEWFGRWEKLSMQCYKHVLEPSAVDIVRIAKQTGGGGTSSPSKNSPTKSSAAKTEPAAASVVKHKQSSQGVGRKASRRPKNIESEHDA